MLEKELIKPLSSTFSNLQSSRTVKHKVPARSLTERTKFKKELHMQSGATLLLLTLWEQLYLPSSHLKMI